MDSHIHVDVCLSVNVFMYLFKYLFKGPDKTKLRVGEVPLSDISDEYILGTCPGSGVWPTAHALRVLLNEGANFCRPEPSINTHRFVERIDMAHCLLRFWDSRSGPDMARGVLTSKSRRSSLSQTPRIGERLLGHGRIH
ncbi:hypothetical protein BDP67DRAFT_203142 [Colletotrichum lupini]|nr:hypothetical protein BDP67DRAFT_203142 [Colletotrichum lupini]